MVTRKDMTLIAISVEPRPDMNIKVAAYAVTQQLDNTQTHAGQSVQLNQAS